MYKKELAIILISTLLSGCSVSSITSILPEKESNTQINTLLIDNTMTSEKSNLSSEERVTQSVEEPKKEVKKEAKEEIKEEVVPKEEIIQDYASFYAQFLKDARNNIESQTNMTIEQKQKAQKAVDSLEEMKLDKITFSSKMIKEKEYGVASISNPTKRLLKNLTVEFAYLDENGNVLYTDIETFPSLQAGGMWKAGTTPKVGSGIKASAVRMNTFAYEDGGLPITFTFPSKNVKNLPMFQLKK